jgi:death-on-curing protein
VPPVFLTLADVIEIHLDQIQRYAGRPGIRDAGLLESAVAMPQAAMGEEYLHGDLFEMAAAYLFHIVKNHPFVDGNKRTGTVAALVFLAVNGVEFEVDDDALVDLVTSVAKGGARKHNVAAFLRRCAKGA